MKMQKAIVVGAGINGVVAAIELRKRGHEVALVDPGPLPHPLAASTDISKAVRAAYGGDEDYTALAEQSREIWRQWNVKFGVELYHEIGFLFMRQRPIQPGERYPAWNSERYPDGFLDLEAGYAESGRAVAALIQWAKSLGVELRENAKFRDLDEAGDRIKGIVLEDGEKIAAAAVVMAVGAWMPYALPFTRNFLRASGQPVFHLKPKQPELFTPERFPIFGADISTTGYYGFPLNRHGVVKIANHGPGREMSPDSPERVVTQEEEIQMRHFMSDSFPSLANSPIVFRRICF